MTVRRGPAAGAAAVLLAWIAVLGLAAPPAHAVGYRYWSFWERTGTGWAFARTGPTGTTPSDGDAEGWRFAVGPDSASAVRPREDPDFAAVCDGVPAAKGHKRIAVVLDFGTAADASGGAVPPAVRTECARIDDDGSAADALAAVAAPLRYDAGGLVCAIAGYPASGCGERASGGSAPKRTSGDDGSPVGLLAGAAAAVVLGAAAVWQARRRRMR